VKPAPFAYARPGTIAEALALLGAGAGEARIIAGGQSLVALLNMRLARPGVLVDINRIPGLDRIEVDGDRLRIGALVRHAQALASPLVITHAPLIAEALPHVAHAAIRNRGTLAGSIALADPAAELPACLLALGGAVEIAGADGVRVVEADDFFLDLYETALASDEMITALLLPLAPERRVAFEELARRHGDYALVGLAASADCLGGRLADVRLAYFAVGSTPVRARQAEAILASGAVDAALVSAAVDALSEDLDPTGDTHASAELKRHLARVLLRRVAARLAEPPQ
jgi:carbon-monoxide dehydrogenase medium subunit